MKLLERLLKGKIKAMIKVNLAQSQKVGDMPEASLEAYNQHGATSELVIYTLLELAKTMQGAETDGQDLGLSVEEKAFYNALADEKRAAEESGAEKLQGIAKALVKKCVILRNGLTWFSVSPHWQACGLL
ncbi:type I restriction enzyme endonuclease domain-containing protein [Lacticaseibacillus paracasei]|jgi:type I restriction enzyme, R subunit|uniref:Type I site-specific deoxyribonuclease n=1 Tax=Lacticaseibacillus paracasei subsp. paracasei Lpp14 TaxID=1256204 RepID=A0A829H134_LACPA|nr:type I restriction enzyme endonuclease domain-containing protein [Lacticaseibacillus paracasei]EPC67872.1 type I site-specific deoxyribonuclease [Lacticaseibacillus paracasei subsp. paracasei Lpp14]RND38040.1 hypothetical protein FAM18099_01760 [Lacticaseibacillus paracasei]